MIVTRLIVGVISALVLLFALFFSEWTFYAVLVAASFLSIWEMYAALQRVGYRPLRWTGLVFSVLIVPAGYFGGMEAVLALLAMLGFASMAHRLFHPECTLKDILSSVFTLFYIGIPFILIFFTFRLRPEAYGLLAVLTAIACSLNSDVFAFFAGTLFGRRKLSPEISPNKTVEGSAGGVIGSVLTGVVLCLWVQRIWGLSIGLEHFIVLGVLCSVTAQTGDLVASSVKRMAGIKDFGTLFPGHGGMLDRIDSILFTVPVVFVYYKYIILG